MTQTYTLQPGDRVGNYEIQHILGTGGFGVIYRALDLILNRDVAIKEYFPTIAMRQKGSHQVKASSDATQSEYAIGLGRFREEARTMIKLYHINIMHALSFFEANGTAYIVMEYEHGQDLDRHMKNNNRPLNYSEIIDIFMPVLSGLRIIHNSALVHFDLKPNNIFIRDDGIPCIIGLDAMQKVVHDTEEKAKTSFMVATDGYSPPEQYSEQWRNKGSWSDIYALGATIYECMSNGQPLIRSTERLDQIINKFPDPLIPATRRFQGQYPQDLLELVDRCLAPQRDRRPQNADEMRDILIKIANNEPINQQKPQLMPPPCVERRERCSQSPSATGYGGSVFSGGHASNTSHPSTNSWQQALEKEINGLKTGKVLFNPPEMMKVGKRERIEARISMNLYEELHHALKGSGAPQEESIPIGHLMKVRLTGEGFTITPLNEEAQVIPNTGHTGWAWDVTPIKSGSQPLHLHIIVRLRLPFGEERKDHPVMEREIKVKIRPFYSVGVFIAKYWQWIIGTLLVPLVGFAWAFFNK